MSRPAPRSAPPKSGGLSLQTLLISSLAAAASAIIVPMFWAKGSVPATALSPIVVALVSEALRRPAQVISKKAPALPLASRSRPVSGHTESWDEDPDAPPTRVQEDPFGLREDTRATPRAQRERRPFPWRIALATGLLAAVIGAGVVTASELGIGHSIGNAKERTSVFGGRSHDHKAKPTPTPSASPGETPAATATRTASPAPTSTASPTPTPTAGETPTASPTVAPQDAAPTPTAAAP